MTHMIQIDNLVREATDEETAIIEARQAENKALEKAAKEKVAARAAALNKLGLSPDEAAALFGI